MSFRPQPYAGLLFFDFPSPCQPVGGQPPNPRDILTRMKLHGSAPHLGPDVWGRCGAFTLGGHRDPSLYRSLSFADKGKQIADFILVQISPPEAQACDQHTAINWHTRLPSRHPGAHSAVSWRPRKAGNLAYVPKGLCIRLPAIAVQ